MTEADNPTFTGKESSVLLLNDVTLTSNSPIFFDFAEITMDSHQSLGETWLAPSTTDAMSDAEFAAFWHANLVKLQPLDRPAPVDFPVEHLARPMGCARGLDIAYVPISWCKSLDRDAVQAWAESRRSLPEVNLGIDFGIADLDEGFMRQEEKFDGDIISELSKDEGHGKIIDHWPKESIFRYIPKYNLQPKITLYSRSHAHWFAIEAMENELLVNRVLNKLSR